jgi:predicted transcriptional regulator
MTPKMTPEQREAVRSAMGPVPIEDDVTNETYFIVNSETMEVLRRQEDLAAIREGLDDITAGRVSPLDESIARIRSQLGLPDSP